jgi:predicted nucleic acid-binding protein
MGKKYLIDTNIIIDYLGNKLPAKAKHLLDNIIDQEINLSVINKIELLGFTHPEPFLSDFVSYANIYHLTDDVVDKTIELRKKHKTKLPDAIIAATAICNNLTLITHNIKDFSKIKNIKAIDPYADL